MRSMTGFGRGSAAGENFNVSIEIKTVNNRFLDANLRLSSELQPYEAAMKKLISERLSRGRVDVNIQFEKTSEVEYELNRPLISGYLSALRQLSEEFDIAGEPDLNFVARLPNAIQVRKEDSNEAFEKGLIEALEMSLTDLEQMRETEGASLKADLSMLLSEIASQLPLIESESANVAAEYLEKLEKRVEKLLSKSESEIELDQARLAQEVAYLADKSDIAEELSRLKSHIEQFLGIMEETGPIGKRLDFLTQELNREANTIASKTQNLTVKEAALKIKGEVEKIREQVQNAE
ncbi:MAG: YicC family protein [Acidobacteriota bacterium]|nr:YicC family protein [Acidobacteriota bacterium]MDH3530321.1 YicC family protein [Acidobacteriota bacterium]